MARKAGLFAGVVTLLRDNTGAGVIAAESATLTDANYPVSRAIDCRGLDTIFVAVEIDAGTNPTATIELLFRDDNAADGSRWKRLQLGARPGVTATALANEVTPALGTVLDFVEMRTFGFQVIYPRISAVANATSTTGLRILGFPGQVRNTRDMNRS